MSKISDYFGRSHSVPIFRCFTFNSPSLTVCFLSLLWGFCLFIFFFFCLFLCFCILFCYTKKLVCKYFLKRSETPHFSKPDWEIAPVALSWSSVDADALCGEVCMTSEVVDVGLWQKNRSYMSIIKYIKSIIEYVLIKSCISINIQNYFLLSACTTNKYREHDIKLCKE